MSGELFPTNVARLTELGVSFTHRPAEHDIKLECPFCGNVMVMHEDKPFLGWPTCHAWMLPFEDVIVAEKAAK